MELTNILFFLCITTLFSCCSSIRVCSKFPYYDIPFSKHCKENERDTQNITEVFKSWGFHSEEYFLTTEDGYIINVVRGYKDSPGKPILLAHGMVHNGLSYVLLDNSSLGYILGNAGYDIWIINFRGTVFSQTRNENISSSSSFWDFSFDQMGKYDVRSTVHLIHNITKQKALYIGFSMGGQAGYIYSSLYPTEAKQYLAGLLNMAPVSYLYHMSSPARLLAPFYKPITAILYPLGKGYLLNFGTLIYYICSHSTVLMYICDTVEGIVEGFSYGQMNPLTYPVQHHYFDFINVGILSHYAQQINDKNFAAYDYGEQKNLEVYNQVKPPVYNVSNISIPVKIYLGKNDLLVTKDDAELFYSELSREYQKGLHMVDYEKFTHLDVIRAKDINDILYRHILESVPDFF